MFCFGILGREENRASTKVYVLYLDPYKFPDTTAEFINQLKQQLVVVIVDAVEEILKLVNGHVAVYLAKTFIPSGAFAFFWL